MRHDACGVTDPAGSGPDPAGGPAVEDAMAMADPDRGRPVVAWLVLALTGGLTLGAAVAGTVAAPPWRSDLLWWLVDLTVGTGFGLVAWLTLLRRSHPAAGLAALVGVGAAASAAAAGWAASAHRWPYLWAPEIPPAGAGFVPAWSALIVVLPWLLPVRPVGRSVRIVVGAAVAAQVFLSTVRYGWVPDELVGSVRDTLALALGPGLPAVLAVLGFAAAAGVLARRRALLPWQRHGLGWLAVGTLLHALALLGSTLDPVLPRGVPVAPLLMLAAQAFLPASVLVLVLRQRLWGLAHTVRQTLVWALTTGLLIGGYALGVVTLGSLLPATSVLPEVLTTAALAAVFHPVRQWVQRRVDRLVHGGGGQPLIRQVADRLRDVDGGMQMLDAVADGIADSLGLATVTITVTGNPGGWLPAQWLSGACPSPPSTGPGPAVPATGPTPSTSATGPGRAHGSTTSGTVPPLTIRLVAGDRLVGVLRAWPRTGERVAGRAASVLADLAPVLAALAELAVAQQALQRSRLQLARGRDEERRKLRRDLHDDLGPVLSGVSLGLAAGRNMLRPHRHLPAVAAADDLLERLVAEVDRQTVAVRDNARDLLPPLLDDGALRPALERLRQRYADAGLLLRVRSPEVNLPEPVATAVYGIVAEAVRNVHRHADVDSCTVEVTNGPEGLEVSVVDEGRGIAPGAAVGVGTRSMQERAEGISADLSIGPLHARPVRPGTRVRLLLPGSLR
ncbi:histidine kinase [Micromonospora maris]|uniref:sensor histidine kinase n=1 Tax=Micromonospora maris TaxID=1003110 RepID=UPI0011D24329|nr:histidine kinase [Micromonospora maris]